MLGELKDCEVSLVFCIVLSSLLADPSSDAVVGIIWFLLPSLAIDSLSDAISSNDVTF